VEGIAELLMREAQGAGAVQMSTGDQDQPLSLAIEKGNLSAVEHYLVSGGDPNLRVDANSLPLHKAIRYGHADIAVLLIGNGADVNGRDAFGCSPLHYAVVSQGPGGRCLPDVAKLLLKKGADVNARSKDGWSPLMSALDNYQQDMADLLRKHGAQR
jgi:ankyrin repeat protein